MRVDKSAPFAGRTQETAVFAGRGTRPPSWSSRRRTTTPAGAPTPSGPGWSIPPIIGKPRTYWREAPLSDIVTVRDNELESVSLIVEDGRVLEGDPVTFTLERGNRENTPLWRSPLKSRPPETT